jgi:hypothetical protein
VSGPEEFKGPGDGEHCPYCAADLNGEPIPESVREHYSGTRWRRELGCEIRGVYDGVLFWVCPDCGRPFHRWPVGSNRYYAAIRYMREVEEARRAREVAHAATQG